MERWGMVEILKEAGRLSYTHFHLFLPFTVAFYLPASLLVSFQTDDPRQGAMEQMLLQNISFFDSFMKTDSIATQRLELGDTGTDMQWGTILMLLIVMGEKLAGRLTVAAFSYIVAHLYSDNIHQGDLEDPNTIRAWQTHVANAVRVKRVFKLLPFAYYRIVVTDLWLVLLDLAVFLSGPILTMGSTSASYLMLMSFVVPGLMWEIFAPVVAVIEPENYSRSAVKRSFKLIKSRMGLFLGYLVVVEELLPSLARGLEAVILAMETHSLPFWGWIVCRILLSALKSATSAYRGICNIVLYFVCKSSSKEL